MYLFHTNTLTQTYIQCILYKLTQVYTLCITLKCLIFNNVMVLHLPCNAGSNYIKLRKDFKGQWNPRGDCSFEEGFLVLNPMHKTLNVFPKHCSASFVFCFWQGRVGRVGAWKFAGDNSKGFSPINVPNQPVDCLVQGIRPVCGPATVGQTTNKGFTGCGLVHRVFCIFDLNNEMQVPN